MEITFRTIDENLSRRERERNEHRQEIINAAIRIFAQKGFPYATLDEVALKAEFSKGAIYNYFNSKENLLFEIIQHVMTFMTLLFQGSLSGQMSLQEELNDLFSNATKIIFKNADLFDLLSRHYAERFQSFSDESRDILQHIDNMNYDIILKRIEKAIERGEIKALNPEVIVETIYGFLRGIINFRWRKTSQDETLDNCRQFVDSIFGGLSR